MKPSSLVRISGFRSVLAEGGAPEAEDAEYVVYPKDSVPTTSSHKRRKNEYGVEDLDKVPRAHISYTDLKCYHCHFTTKVRYEGDDRHCFSCTY